MVRERIDLEAPLRAYAPPREMQSAESYVLRQTV
jgi:hypothetical protein